MFVHKTAEVQSKKIGKDTKIWQYVIISETAQIGEGCNISAYTFIENDVHIGNNVTVKCGVYIWDGVTIEDNVFIGPNVTFTNDKYPRSKVYPDQFDKTLIKKGASIGANSTIICGITIGEGSIIGAGSVVTRDVSPNAVCYGNPAEQHGFLNVKISNRLKYQK